MPRTHGIIVSILGKQWELLFKRRMPDNHCGECDNPNTPGKQIRIRKGMREELELDTTIHEMLHAAGWHIDEPFVEQFATDAAAILMRLGWRKTEGD